MSVACPVKWKDDQGFLPLK